MIKLQGPSQIITHDEQIKVFREGRVVYVDGKPKKQNITNFIVIGNVQPLNGRELLLVPEHDRFKEQYYIYTNELNCPIAVNDRVHRCGVNFQVQETEQWGSYIRARIMRDDTGPNATP